MKILILGSNSFAGGWLVRESLKKGAQVIGVNRSPLGSPLLCAFSDFIGSKKLQLHTYDLNKQLQSVVEIIMEEKPHVIVDFAGQGMVAPSWDTPEDWYQTNLVSKTKLINEITSARWLEKYIKISTPEVYGSTSGALSESTLYNPSTPYAVSHAAVDAHLMNFHKYKNFPVIFGRFANFYGEHQRLHRIIPKAFWCAKSGEMLKLDGGGLSKRAFLHGEDVTTAVWSMIERGILGEIYHFSTNEVVNIKQLVEKIAVVSSRNFDEFVSVGEDRLGKDAAYELSSEKAKKKLNWRPTIALDEGLSRVHKWMQKDFESFKGLEKNYIHKQ